LGQYAKLTEEEIKSLIVEHKWMFYMESTVHTEMQRIKELGERYDQPLPGLFNEVNQWEAKVSEHLVKMGYSI
jgi:type I restriction enzyme M protein